MKKLSRRHYTIVILILATIFIEVSFIAVKNNYIYYQTPEEAFAAAHFGRSKAQIVLKGQETAFVIG